MTPGHSLNRLAIFLCLRLFLSHSCDYITDDPDGYWVEVCKRSEKANIANECNFSQTMLRVKDPKKSVAFYQRLGMKLLKERHFDDFSLYFMASSSADESIEANNQFQPILELTHNHGTEDDKDFVHYNGNEEGRQGFGHVG